jgi:hypothetical protein
MLTFRGGLGFNAGRSMRHDDARFGLVPMLTAGARITGRANIDVRVTQSKLLGWPYLEAGERHGAGMDTSCAQSEESVDIDVRRIRQATSARNRRRSGCQSCPRPPSCTAAVMWVRSAKRK